jgi:APA family basic amino acid/polyamine antiporter
LKIAQMPLSLPTPTAAPPTELARTLGLADATAVVVGIVVGAGIFLAPRLVAQALPSASLILAVWIASGVLCFFGALAYAEMGAMMPESGGHYVYVRECYGPLAGFLCGWTFALVVIAAAMSWLAVSFSITLAYWLPMSPMASKLVALALLSALSFVNYRGIRLGAALAFLLFSEVPHSTEIHPRCCSRTSDA